MLLARRWERGSVSAQFGQRAKANITVSTTVAAPTPAINTLTPAKTEHFVLSAWDSATGQSGILINDEMVPYTIALISKGFQGFQEGKVLTFLDSGASDTMFVLRDSFAEYKPLSSHVGDSAKAKDGGFEIVGEGNVTQ